MAYRLNLDVSPRKYTKGNVEMFLNWANCTDRAGQEPAMIFRKRQGETRGLVAVRLSEIHCFMDSNGYALESAVQMGIRIAQFLGGGLPDRQSARDIVDLIVEYTPDLVRMPPDPPPAYLKQVADAGQKAELAIKIDGQTVMETEVAA